MQNENPRPAVLLPKMEKVNLAEKFAAFTEHWRPKIVGELNGQEVKVVKFQGVFPWHHHESEDELFLVWRGRMRIEVPRPDSRVERGRIPRRAARLRSIARRQTRKRRSCFSSRRRRATPGARRSRSSPRRREFGSKIHCTILFAISFCRTCVARISSMASTECPGPLPTREIHGVFDLRHRRTDGGAARCGKLLPNEIDLLSRRHGSRPVWRKSAAHVERYSLEIAELLLGRKLQDDRRRLQYRFGARPAPTRGDDSVPVIGVIRPGAEAAVAATRNGHIGVIGTRATIKSGAYERAIRALDDDVQVTARACPLFVPLIEEGWLESEITDRVIRQYLTRWSKMGSIRWSRLHPLSPFCGGDRTVSGRAGDLGSIPHKTARRRWRDCLKGENLTQPLRSGGELTVALTDPPDAFLEVALEALQLDIGTVQLRAVLHSAR